MGPGPTFLGKERGLWALDTLSLVKTEAFLAQDQFSLVKNRRFVGHQSSFVGHDPNGSPGSFGSPESQEPNLY